jgi:coenzyme PQQ precursor peptide PqqA
MLAAPSAGGSGTLRAHENHEARFLMMRIRPAVGNGHTCRADQRSNAMKWETPQATDFRFGMEITMYIANR